MLSKEEEAFIEYWKANREKQKRVFRQFLLGIPLAPSDGAESASALR